MLWTMVNSCHCASTFFVPRSVKRLSSPCSGDSRTRVQPCQFSGCRSHGLAVCQTSTSCVRQRRFACLRPRAFATFEDADRSLDGALGMTQTLRAQRAVAARRDRRLEMRNSISVEQQVLTAVIQLVTGRADAEGLLFVIEEVLDAEELRLLRSSSLCLRRSSARSFRSRFS
jgi:hypothetical protein